MSGVKEDVMAKRKAKPKKLEPLKVHVRWMVRRDIPENIEIDQSGGFWAEEDFLRHLRQRNMIGMVAEIGEKVVGFMVYALEKYHLEIMNFCVHPSFRLQNVGTQMIDRLLSKLSSHRRTRLKWTVRERSTGLLLFLRRMKFLAMDIRRQHFDDEDGIVMVYRFEQDGEPEAADVPANRIEMFKDAGDEQ